MIGVGDRVIFEDKDADREGVVTHVCYDRRDRVDGYYVRFGDRVPSHIYCKAHHITKIEAPMTTEEQQQAFQMIQQAQAQEQRVSAALLELLLLLSQIAQLLNPQGQGGEG